MRYDSEAACSRRREVWRPLARMVMAWRQPAPERRSIAKSASLPELPLQARPFLLRIVPATVRFGESPAFVAGGGGNPRWNTEAVSPRLVRQAIDVPPALAQAAFAHADCFETPVAVYSKMAFTT